MTVIKDLEAAQGEIATLKASIENVTASVSAKDTEIETLKGQIATMQSEKDEMKAAHDSAIADIQGKLDAEIKAHAESKKAIEDANKKLADPAFKAASVDGDKQAVVEGGAVSGAVSGKTKAEQMRDISDPKERRAFYLANEKDIKAGL